MNIFRIFLRATKNGTYKPDSIYVYAYGLTVDGERTTDIYKVEFETVAVPKIDVTFTVDATVNGPLCDLHVEPSDPNQRYVIGMYVADQVQDGEDACRQYQQYLSDMIVIYEAMGMTAEETVAGLSVVGTTDRTYELEENTEYLVFAASCTDNGLINSAPVSTTFRTTEVQPSDNRISFEVTSLEAHAATIDVKTETSIPMCSTSSIRRPWRGWTTRRSSAPCWPTRPSRTTSAGATPPSRRANSRAPRATRCWPSAT